MSGDREPMTARGTGGVTTPSCAGKIALITGGARGLGAAMAVRLANEGARVVVTARTSAPNGDGLEGSLQETVRRIDDAGGEAVAVVADLADRDLDRGAIIQAARDAFGGPIDILVNNAAARRGYEYGFSEVPRDLFDEAVQVNVWAAWDLAQRVVPGMRERGSGWILNVSSVQASPRVGPPYPSIETGDASVYGGTKAMVDRMTTGAAMELYKYNIAVNSLAPEGRIDTPSSRSLVTPRPGRMEPIEAFVEAAVALCTSDPCALTGRVTASLSLLVDLQRPVHHLDGKTLLDGWQPDDISQRKRPA
jgi:citronellol/citronellal dehydrogenase